MAIHKGSMVGLKYQHFHYILIWYLDTQWLIYVMWSVKTRRMSKNAKLSFWSHFKAKSELFPKVLKFCLNDIHIQSYNLMMLSSSTLLYTSFLTISSYFSECCFATSDGFLQIASHIRSYQWDLSICKAKKGDLWASKHLCGLMKWIWEKQ